MRRVMADGDEATLCLLCSTTIEVGAEYQVMPLIAAADDGTPLSPVLAGGHLECLLRDVMGGIGHLTDHEFWCRTVGDPDGGMTYRESALAVRRWVDEHGLPT
jgi:hypothetical protein